MENDVNGQDKRDLNVILERMEQSDRDREQMHTDIKFIKENMFNPHEGLWAEKMAWSNRCRFHRIIY